jgi:hypothetical protein
MKGKRLELTLPVDFTQEELDDRRDRLSSAALRYDAVEEEKKTSNAHFTDQLKALRGEVRSLAKAIRRKKEDRDVPCVARFHDPSPFFKTVIRMDTGEVVRAEPMTHDERQDNLFEDVEEIQRMYAIEDGRQEIEPPADEAPPPAEDQPPA